MPTHSQAQRENMDMLKIKEILVPGYKRVIEAIDQNAGLHSFIAIHDTTLGPALGGARIYPYANPKAALEDVLRLAKGMTYKSALSECGLGGGKSVIIADPHKDKTDSLLLAFGEAIHSLKGDYITAEDVGSSPEDMMIIRRSTPYVTALPTNQSSGDPSHFTAWGVFKGMQAVAQKLWHNKSLRNKRILIQGLGHVGSKLAALLFWEGADLILSDIDLKQMHGLAHLYGAKIVMPADSYSTPCDIFSPCAMGGILNDKTIPQLKCRAIVGSANNQLGTPEHGFLLMKSGILYAPDYIVNSGGLINVSVELDPLGYDPKASRDRVDHIYDRMLSIFHKSEKEHKSTSQVADEIAEYNLQNKVGMRAKPIIFK